MSITNTTDSYGLVTKTFHWLTALLIITAIPLGLIANNMPYGTGEELASKASLFSLHKTVGVAAFLVALARILWALTQTKPAPLHPDRRAETFLAELVHWSLYAAMVVVPLSGWIHHAATEGFAPILWPLGQNLPLVAKSEPIAAFFASIHFVFTKVLALSILLHIAGAVKHVLIDRDGTLARMTTGSVAAAPNGHTHTRTPMFAALGIYALGFAGAFALAQQHDGPVVPTLAEVVSDWQVQDGKIEITVEQLGANVTGGFADWTAGITFNEVATDGVHGTADVTISIGSLTLGSVTSQALGNGFFEADIFPTATFFATLLPDESGYVADGVLTVRDIELPLQLPFELQLDADTATMSASTIVDRRAFDIGMQYQPSDGLGWSVQIDIALTAKRSAQ